MLAGGENLEQSHQQPRNPATPQCATPQIRHCHLKPNSQPIQIKYSAQRLPHLYIQIK